MAAQPILIEGNVLEGGGQILRMALALSAIQRKPIRVTKIRAGRSNPGLRAQHLCGLKLVSEISSGALEGAHLGSEEIEFRPGQLNAVSECVADTQTAGSVCLLAQAAFPVCLFSNGLSRITLRGGTNAEMAPQVDYYMQVFRKVAARFGADFKLYVKQRGYYPQGGGEVSFEVKCSPDGLKPVVMTDPGHITSIRGQAFVAGALPMKVAHAMADAASLSLRQQLNLPDDVPIRINRYKENPDTTVGSGSGIILWTESTSGCILGGSSLGKKGTEAEVTGHQAAQEIIDAVRYGACVDHHAQDQVIVLMSLAKGKSRLQTGPITMHTKTAIHVAELMTQARFHIMEDPNAGRTLIECDGIGKRPEHMM
ncbi:RNA 3'-terminal phosphate cyclase [Oratosquilla oratoria]|uniref:RNA 3'-terminal phosphate cyclase n=1 Tax=Oratosquilla oratoria TaxID=337810 RepID=UPI003F761D1F